MPLIVCTPKVMPPELEELARRRSIEINPANAHTMRTVERTVPGARRGLRRLALVIGNRWPASKTVLSVQFLDSPPKDLRERLLSHMNAWNQTVNIRFTETSGTGEVRVARIKGDGYWSWVGTEILAIDEAEPTMNLEGFTMKTSESEFRRVVRHEAGHTLGFDHEHMRAEFVERIDRKKAIAYFKRTQGWSEKEIEEQVLTPLKKKSIMGTTEADPVSIMCYQIPGKITKDGKAIPGGTDINERDFAFAGSIYPKSKAKAETIAEASPEVPAPAPQLAAPVPTAAATSQDTDTFSIVIMDGFDGDAKPRPPGKEKRPPFARVLASYAGAQVVTTLKLHSDKNGKTTWGRIIAIHERIKAYANREQGTLPDEARMRQFGAELFETLINGDTLRLYDEARARQQNRKLDIVLTSMIPWVAEKPWEFAFDAKRQSFLATEDVNLVRNVITAVPAYVTASASGPLRILVVAAQPVGFGSLSIDEETEVIRRGFEPLMDVGLVTVDVLARATPGRLHGKLSTARFDVVHFIGHGSFDDTTQEGAIYFEDDRGNEVAMGVRSMREIFCKRGVNLVFLNACQSGSGGRKDYNVGVAQSLVAHGMPAVVANQYSVLDTSATSFAQHFYWSIAQGMSVGQAACEARIAVNYSAGADFIDWAVPVLFTRAPFLKLCAPIAKPVSTPAAFVTRSRRQAIMTHKVRIAVWDIDSAFPDISATLQTLNGVQGIFGFELVSLSIPIRAWDLETKSPDGTPYLWAEHFVQQVKRVLPELDVDMLICVSAHWMRNDNELNLFAAWPGKVPITIFSCAGYELEPRGHTTDRAIANSLVSLIAGYRGELDSHDRNPKQCPMYYNGERNRDCVVGPLQFDAKCHAALTKKLSADEVAALDAVLNAFA